MRPNIENMKEVYNLTKSKMMVSTPERMEGLLQEIKAAAEADEKVIKAIEQHIQALLDGQTEVADEGWHTAQTLKKISEEIEKLNGDQELILNEILPVIKNELRDKKLTDEEINNHPKITERIQQLQDNKKRINAYENKATEILLEMRKQKTRFSNKTKEVLEKIMAVRPPSPENN